MSDFVWRVKKRSHYHLAKDFNALYYVFGKIFLCSRIKLFSNTILDKLEEKIKFSVEPEF